LIQQHVREDYLGRVFSVFGMITGSVMPLAMLVFGPIADRLRIEWLLMGSGIAMLATGTLMLASKVLVGDHHPDTV
jgi:DHA3 family macrolide efflux protein-like MFS transporter